MNSTFIREDSCSFVDQLHLSYNAAVKPLRRWAWNIFCALSLLIFATSVTLWVRSFRSYDSFIHDAGAFRSDSSWRRFAVCWFNGKIAFLYHREDGTTFFPQVPLWTELDIIIEDAPGGTNLSLAGCRLVWGKNTSEQGTILYKLLVLPLWLFLLIFALPPLVWWRQRRKRRQGGGSPAQGGRGFPLAAEGSQAADLNGQAS